MFNIKKLFCIFFSLLLSFAFTGCTGQDQANELILIHSIGIDKNENGYKLTMQTYDTTNSEGKAVSSAVGENIKIVTAQGDSIYSALRQSEMSEGKKIFTGHNMLIVLGDSVIREDIHKVLNYFVNDDLTFSGIIVAVAKGNAQDVIDVKIDDEILSASTMTDIIKKSIHSSRAVDSQFVSIVNDLANNQSTTVLPVIVVQEESGKKVFRVNSTAVIKNSKLVDTLNEEETIGLNLLIGKAKTVSLSINVDNNLTQVYLDGLNTKLRPQIKDGKLVMKAVISYNIAKREMLSDFNESFYISHDKLQKEVKAKVLEKCNLCIDKVIRKDKVDALDIEQYLKFYQKDFFRETQNNYDAILSDMIYDITIKGQVVD